MISGSSAKARRGAYPNLRQHLHDARMRAEFSPVTHRSELINLASSERLYYALEEAGLLDAPEPEEIET